MTFCGYNDTIGSALHELVAGMVQAMRERHARGTPIRQVLLSELADLRQMNTILGAEGTDSPQIGAFIAINLFAQALFANTMSDTLEDFEAACSRFGSQFVELVRDTENDHQEELTTRKTVAGDAAAIIAVAERLVARSAQSLRALEPAS